MTKILALKIDVDTERGTRIGVPNLLRLLKALHIPATFLFALGPDNTGRALKRIFRPGFLKKVSRTSVISTYGVRTLLNGVLWPGPHIGRRQADVMRQVQAAGFEVGIHCYDHIRWQDGVNKMSQMQICDEFQRAVNEFQRVFATAPKTAGAPGWQANAKTLTAYDKFNLLYASDCRGRFPFIPKVKGQVFKTLQIPTTLPTLDELVGDPEYPIEKLTSHYLSLLKNENPNVMTCHAELEGMKYLDWYREFLTVAVKEGVQFQTMETIANKTLQNNIAPPIKEMIQGEVTGRSGKLAMQQ